MSSLSLPRVLQQRKTSLEQERESFEKSQGISISKAINQVENPVKEKHVRSAILGTFHEKCAETFWAVVMRLPLQDNRIAAWKFCHVLHKLLREGHPQTLNDSYRHVSRIEDLGKLWGHLRDCYGKLIQDYCKLLIGKIHFHRRNPRIPGNLVLSSDDLETIGENDVNNFFQLCVEMFDYMDEILNLESAIFGSLDMSRSNSMTSCGQCRLAPLIPMVQDSSQLYDCCVKLLFKLHASLPMDLLSGHRARFLDQFKKLSLFYVATSNLQYFKNLIHVPVLPTNPPNFLIQSDFGTYVTPVVILPTVEPESLEPESGDLVDLNSPTNGNSSLDTSPDHFQSAEKDVYISQLINEMSNMKIEMTALITEHQENLQDLYTRLEKLQNELNQKEHQLKEEKRLKDNIAKASVDVTKFQESEHKTKLLEEKFQKLKEVYSKLREEHIQLIRQKADVDKQLSSLKNLELDANEKAKLELLAKELSMLQASVDEATEQKQTLESKLELVNKEKNEIEKQVKELRNQKNEIELKLISTSNENNKLAKNLANNFEKVVKECEELIKNSIHEVDNPAFSSSTCSIDYFTSLSDGLNESMESVEKEVTIDLIVRLTHRTAEFVLLGKATSNISPDIEFGEKMGEMCKKVGYECLKVLEVIKNNELVTTISMKNTIVDLLTMVATLQTTLLSSSASVGDLIESELAAMDKAIEEAAKKIEEMLSHSRAADSGLKLEVNEKILDSCTGLMQAIRILVQKSRILQAEIVSQGKGTATAKEFYKRNHQWTEGLISAAKAVGMGATYLLEAADEVVTGGGKIELVMAAVQGISASTAQLVVASRVKAERGSKSLELLTNASRGVTQATAGVLTSAKACVQLVEASDDLDVAGLTLYTAKRLEMESQVKVLELENSLAKERLKLSALRRQHYSMAPENDPISPI